MQWLLLIKTHFWLQLCSEKYLRNVIQLSTLVFILKSGPNVTPSIFCREPLPGIWDSQLDSFQKLLVLRCLRGDKVTNAMQDFVAANLGQSFIEPQVANSA